LSSDSLESDHDDCASDLFGRSTSDEVEFARETEEGNGESTSVLKRESSNPGKILRQERLLLLSDVVLWFRISKNLLKVDQDTLDEHDGIDFGSSDFVFEFGDSDRSSEM